MSDKQTKITLETLAARIEKLEQVVFDKRGKSKNHKATTDASAEVYKGATGGVRLLVTKNYFDQKRKLGDIISELQNLGYHYSKQAIQDAANRLARPGGPLVNLTEKGRKIYAKRR